MRHAFLVFLLLVFYHPLYSQDTLYTRWAIITRPLAWFDPQNQNLCAGLQYRISNVRNVQVEAGLINSFYQDWVVDSFNVHYTGYRVSAEYMHFLEGSPFYISGECMYKNFSRSRDEWMLRMGGTYQQKFRVHKYYNVSSFRFKAGVSTNRWGSRVHLDLAAALGLRTKYVTFSQLPDDVQFLEMSNFENETTAGRSYVPELSFTITMVYKIKKK